MIVIPSWRPRRLSVQGLGPRLQQVRRHILARNDRVEIPQSLDRLLLPGVETRFRQLRTSDQQHLIAVAESLSRNDAGDDLVTAGLLHDIGKAAPGITIRLTDRVAKVLLENLAPIAIAHISRQRAPRYGNALWVLARHAQTGSELAAQAGYDQRVQWLIANHERSEPVNDPDLLLLIAVDEASDRYPAG